MIPHLLKIPTYLSLGIVKPPNPHNKSLFFQGGTNDHRTLVRGMDSLPNRQLRWNFPHGQDLSSANHLELPVRQGQRCLQPYRLRYQPPQVPTSPTEEIPQSRLCFWPGK